MSTIDVANLSDAESTTTNSGNTSDVLNNTTTVDTKFITNGSAKAWVRVNQIPTTQVIDSSLNISTISDLGTGQTMANLATGMTSSNFPVGSSQNSNQGGNLVSSMNLSTEMYFGFYVSNVYADGQRLQGILMGELA